VVKAEIVKAGYRISNFGHRREVVACLWIEYRKNSKAIVTENSLDLKSVMRRVLEKTGGVCGGVLRGESRNTG